MGSRIISSLLRFGTINNDNGIRALATCLVNAHGHALAQMTNLESDRGGTIMVYVYLGF